MKILKKKKKNSWSKNEKIIILNKISEEILKHIFDKSLTKVLDWGTYLCGLINEAEPSRDPDDENY